MVNTKPLPTRPKFLLLVRYTFRINASIVSPRDVGAIEHLMRKGRRQLEMYEDHGVTDCWMSGDMLKWDKMQKTPARSARRTDI
jgi:succinate dehydrogenase assembly factor 1